MRSRRQKIMALMDEGCPEAEAIAIINQEAESDRRRALRALKDFERRGGTTLEDFKKELEQ